MRRTRDYIQLNVHYCVLFNYRLGLGLGLGLRLGLGLGLGLDSVSGWLVVMHTQLSYFPS